MATADQTHDTAPRTTADATHPLAPYDAVLLQSFGGPEAPEEVLPFLRRVTAGRGIPDERLVEVGAHYELFGGVSPIGALNRRLVADLAAELAARGCPVPLVLGNRNSAPFVGDALADLVAGGARRVLAVPTSAWRSWSGCRQYREDLAKGVAEHDLDITLDKVRPYGEHPAVAGTWAALLLEAVRPLVEGGARPHLLFVTHSIPESMDETSGPGDGEGRAYSHGQVALARELLAEVSGVLGVELDGGLAFCSRSGPPSVPWLEPDVNDRITELAADGVTDVVLVPIGFVSDHMEVVYDLDTQAAQTAEEHGVRLIRVPTAGSDAEFVTGLADLLAERAAEHRGEPVDAQTWRGLPASPSICPAGCCPNLRDPRPAVGERS